MRFKKLLSAILATLLVTGGVTGAIPFEKKTAMAAEIAGETTAYKGVKYSDLDTVVNDGTYTGISGSFEDPGQEIGASIRNLTAVYKVVLPEDGKVYAKFWRKEVAEYNNDVDFILYSDINLTNEVIGKVQCYDFDPVRNVFLSLKKGTYYLEVKSDRLFSNNIMNVKYGAYFGYLPNSTDFIDLDLSESKATNDDVTVTVKVNEDCSKIWAMSGSAPDYMLDNQYYWEDTYLVKNNQFTVTNNGLCTVRIQDIYGTYWQEVLNVKNIDKTAPKTPSVKGYKAGTTKITGTAEKSSKVYVIVGSKTYKATASKSSGVFSVKTAKLKKGTSIKVYCMDAAGNKSKYKKVTVK